MSVAPARRNFTVWKGSTFRKRLTLLVGDANSGPRDLTGADARFVIWNKPGGTELRRLTVDNGGVTLGGTAGTIDLYVSATDTGAFAWPTGVYQLYLTTASDTEVILYGGFRVKGF